jgi:hypothetical protein
VSGNSPKTVNYFQIPALKALILLDNVEAFCYNLAAQEVYFYHGGKKIPGRLAQEN